MFSLFFCLEGTENNHNKIEFPMTINDVRSANDNECPMTTTLCLSISINRHGHGGAVFSINISSPPALFPFSHLQIFKSSNLSPPTPFINNLITPTFIFYSLC
jgi:hypothetical protein